MVSTVNAYAHVNIKSLKNNKIILNAPQLNLKTEGLIDYKNGKLDIKIESQLLLLKCAVEVSLRYANAIGKTLSGIEVTTHNDDAFSYKLTNNKITKSGLGSSAAITVAAVKGVLKIYGFEDNEVIHKLAQVAHALATGKVGSGFDIAAATYGSIVYVRYSPEIVKSFPVEYTNLQLLELINKKWDYKIEKFLLPKQFRIVFATFINEAMITTKAVGSVSEFKLKNNKLYKKLITELNLENEKAINALSNFDSHRFLDAFDKGRVLLKKLGSYSNIDIEPDDCTELIEESKKNGAFACRLPGAGGKDAIAALCLNEKDEMQLRDFWSSKKNLQVFEIELESFGNKKEVASKL